MIDFYGLRKDVETIASRVEEIRLAAGLEKLEADLTILEEKAADSSLWDDRLKAQETLLALTDVKEKIKLLSDFKSQVISWSPLYFFLLLFTIIVSVQQKHVSIISLAKELNCVNTLQVEEAETIVSLTEEMDSIDTGLLEEASNIIRELTKSLDRFELTQLLSGQYDKEGSVVTITAGAGGTDAQVSQDLAQQS